MIALMLAFNTAPSCYILALRGYSSDEATSLLYCQACGLVGNF